MRVSAGSDSGLCGVFILELRASRASVRAAMRRRSNRRENTQKARHAFERYLVRAALTLPTRSVASMREDVLGYPGGDGGRFSSLREVVEHRSLVEARLRRRPW